MERITIEVKDPADAQLLLAFAKRIGSTVITDSKEFETHITKKSRSIIEQGCDISSFGDPSEWQRSERLDRELPLRGK